MIPGPWNVKFHSKLSECILSELQWGHGPGIMKIITHIGPYIKTRLA